MYKALIKTTVIIAIYCSKSQIKMITAPFSLKMSGCIVMFSAPS